jgi:myo-inositol-1(or 4)-monophosphatase
MLNTAIKAARAAGAIINRASLDLDLLADQREVLAQRLRHRGGPRRRGSHHRDAAHGLPGHGILAEESGRTHGAKHSDYVWIIDPLDGTTNFIHGFPVYAVSIALSFRGQIQQAVVYDPTRNDLFYATKGRGAFLNDKRLRVSKRIRIGEALIGTGFPFRKGDNFKRYLKMFEELSQACAGLRRRAPRRSTSATWRRATTTASSRRASLPGTWQQARSSSPRPAAWWATSPANPTSSTSARWWPARRESTVRWCRSWRPTPRPQGRHAGHAATAGGAGGEPGGQRPGQAGRDHVVAALAAAAPAPEAATEPARKKGAVRIRKTDAQAAPKGKDTSA